jgi:hypothetical protein
LPFEATGKLSEKDGNPALTLALRGKGTLSETDDEGHTKVSKVSFQARLFVTLDPISQTMTGKVTASVTVGGKKLNPGSEVITLELPAPLDGAWELQVSLSRDARGKPVAEARMVLPNREAPLLFKGKGKDSSRGGTTALSLVGDASQRNRGRARLILSQVDGQPRIKILTGKVLGQRLR